MTAVWPGSAAAQGVRAVFLEPWLRFTNDVLGFLPNNNNLKNSPLSIQTLILCLPILFSLFLLALPDLGCGFCSETPLVFIWNVHLPALQE